MLHRTELRLNSRLTAAAGLDNVRATGARVARPHEIARNAISYFAGGPPALGNSDCNVAHGCLLGFRREQTVTNVYHRLDMKAEARELRT